MRDACAVFACSVRAILVAGALMWDACVLSACSVRAILIASALREDAFDAAIALEPRRSAVSPSRRLAV